MTVGERIKQRRLDLKLTQEELAKRLHYKGKSAVCRIEKEGNNITTDRIEKFAKALECTPGYLMGWQDSPTETQLNIFDLIDPQKGNAVRKQQFEEQYKDNFMNYDLAFSLEEQNIIICYRDLSEKEKQLVKRLLAYQERFDENGKDLYRPQG